MNAATQQIFADRPPVSLVSGPEVVISQADFAGRVRVSRSAVSQAVSAGRFSADAITSQGFLRWPRCLTDWYDNADTRRHGPGKTNGVESVPESAANQAADLPEIVNPTPADFVPPAEGSLAFERIETSRLRRRQMEREIAIREGLYRPVAEIESAMADLGRKVRRVLQTIPAWSEDVMTAAAGGDPATVRAALKRKTRDLCEAVALAMVAGDPVDAADPDTVTEDDDAE